MNGNHLKHMLFAGAGVFGVLLLVGLPLTSALLYAVALSCPLMMFTMGGHGHGGAGRDPSSRSSDEQDESTDRPHQHHHH